MRSGHKEEEMLGLFAFSVPCLMSMKYINGSIIEFEYAIDR